jgi:hypothetical protein
MYFREVVAGLPYVRAVWRTQLGEMGDGVGEVRKGGRYICVPAALVLPGPSGQVRSRLPGRSRIQIQVRFNVRYLGK